MRGDRFDTDARSDPRAPAGPLAAKSTLVFELGPPFAGGSQTEDLDRSRHRTRGAFRPRAVRTGDDGCTREAEEGNPRNTPRSASPSLGLSAHVARATGSRRRKVSSRWMAGLIPRSPSLNGGKRLRGVSASARGSRPVGLFPREGRSHHGAQNAKGVAASVALRGSKLVSVLVRRFSVAEVDRRPLPAS